MIFKKNTLYVLFILLVTTSCVNTRKFVYFNDLQKASGVDSITNFHSVRIQPGDVLQITITTIDRDITAVLNPSSANPAFINNTAPGYLVDSLGNIDIPLAGKISVNRKTLMEINDLIKLALSKTVKNLHVSTRLLNFRIAVLGAVNRPGSYNITSDRTSILDALGLAGDLNIGARWDDVMLIRETNGKRVYQSLNLNNSETLASPFFYLQNNDVVYVKPAPNRLATNSTGFQLLPTVFGAISLILVSYSTLRR